MRGDADRKAAAEALAAALRVGASRLVTHDLCLARALVLAGDEVVEADASAPDPEDDDQTMASGTVVHGTVIQRVESGSFVDIGLGVDAYLPDTELPRDQSSAIPSVGSSVDAMVVSVEPGTGKVRLSLRALIGRDEIARLAFGDRLTGTVAAHRPGGCFVDLGFADAFLSDADGPPSAGGGRPPIGSSIDVFVLAADPDRGSVRVTRRDLRAEREVFDTLTEGQLVHGHVIEVTEIGVFVDLGGVVGLIYDRHLPRDTAGAPLVEFLPGQEVEAEVLHVRAARGQIGLSMRHLERARFDAATGSVQPGDTLDVTVVGSAPFGVFVDALGIRGLVHRNELSWDRSVSSEDYPIGTVALWSSGSIPRGDGCRCRSVVWKTTPGARRSRA
jgi:small subunit ribosomal protein S1